MLAPLVVLLSGYGMCPTRATGPLRNQMVPNARFLLSKIEAKLGQRPPMLVSCFGLIPWRVKHQEESTLESEWPERTGMSELIERVKELSETPQGNRELILIGHSFGAWTAMDLVLRLPQHKVRYLATIDPISMRNCKPLRFGYDWVKWAMRATPDSACCRNPADLEVHYPVIAQKAGLWLNAYQSQTPYLHSSDIPQAHVNMPRVYPPVRSPAGAHGWIPVDPVIWTVIEGGILNAYNLEMKKELSAGDTAAVSSASPAR